MSGRLAWLAFALYGAVGCGGIMTYGGFLPELDSGQALPADQKGPSAQTSGPDALVKRASVYFEHGQIARAERLNQRALIRQPRHLGGLVIDARIATARGDLDRAWTRFDHALTLYRGTGAVGFILGEVVPVAAGLSRELREDGRPVEALQLMDRLKIHVSEHTRLFTSSLRAVVVDELHQVALLLLRSGLVVRAEEALDLSLIFGARNTSGEGAFAVAQIRALGGDTDRERLHSWARQVPRTRWLRVARWHESHHESEAARFAYEASTKADSASVQSWRGLARICLSGRDVGCAQDAFARAASFGETNEIKLELILGGARSLKESAGNAHSLPLYETSVSLAPGNWEVVKEALTALGRNRRYKAVEQIVFDYVQGATDPDAALDRGIRKLLDLRLSASAAQVIRRLGEVSNPPRSLPLAVANNLPTHRVHDAERATLLAQYIRAAPDELNAQLESARAWLKVRRFEQARRHALRAQVLDSGHPLALLLEAESWDGQHDERRAQTARKRVRSCARSELRCVVALGEYELDAVGPGRALNLLQPWLKRDGVELTPDFHRVRYRAAMDNVRRFPHLIEPALRSWLALVPQEERRTSLEDALVRIGGEPKLRPVRIELLRELDRWAHLEDRSRRSLVRELQAEGRVMESIAVWERIVRDADDPNAANMEAGASLHKRGFDEEAVRFFDRVHVSRITDDSTHQSLAEVFTRRGQRERASVHHERLISSSSTRTNPVRLRKYVRALIAHRDGERALEVNGLLLEVAPRDREALMSNVRIAILLGDEVARSAAVDELVLLTQRNSRSGTWAMIGEALVAQGLVASGLEAYERAIEGARRRGDRNKYLKSIADLCATLGEPRRLLALETLFLKEKKSAEGVLALALELEGYGLPDEAAGLLNRALERPDIKRRKLLYPAFQNAAWRGAFEEGERWLGEFLDHETTKARSWSSAAEVWWSVGESARALELITKATRRYPNDWDVTRVQADLLFKGGDRAAAEDVYVKAMAGATLGEGLFKKMADVLRGDRMNDWLHSLLVRATATLETRQEPLLERVRTALEIGNEDMANALLSRYLGVERRGHSEVAKLAKEAKWPALALRHYEWSLNEPMTGAEPFPVTEYAELLVAQGRGADRERRFREVVRRAKDSGRAMIDVARVLLERGGRDAALHWLAQAEDLDSTPEIKLLRGHVYLELGQVERAADVFERVVRARSMEKSSRGSVRLQRKSRVLSSELSQIAQAFESRGEFAAGAVLIRRLTGSYGAIAGRDLSFAGHEAHLLIRSGQIERGLSVIQQIHFTQSSHAGKPQLWLRLAAALADRGLRTEAIALLARVMKHVSNVDLHYAHLRYLVAAGRGNSAWRAARILMGRFQVDTAARAIEIALDGGLNNLAIQVVTYAAETHSPPRLLALNDLLRMRGVERPGGHVEASEKSAVRLRVASDVSVRKGDFTAGAQSSLSALRLEPGHSPTQRKALRLAAHVGDEGAFEEALELISRGARSRHTGLRLGAQILSASGMIHRALDLRQRAMALEPGEPSLAMETFLTALDGGRVDLASSLAVSALERWGDQDDIRLEIAESWLRYGEPERARRTADLDRTRRGPRVWRAAKLDAAIHHAQGEIGEAIGGLSHGASTAMNPLLASVEAFDQVEAWGGSSVALSRIVDAVEPALARSPAIRLLRIRLGWRTGSVAESATALEELLSDAVLTPSEIANGLYQAARAAQEGAIETLLAALVSHIGSLEARRVAGLRTLLALDRDAAGFGPTLTPDQRRSLALRAVGWMEGGLAEAFLPGAGHVSSVGHAYEMAGRREASLWLYENHALQIPWDSSARNNWAYSLVEAERELPLALSMIQRTGHEKAEPVPSFLDTEAWALHKLGRDDEALKVMKRAILHATDARYQAPEGRVEMMFHHGKILEANDELEEARNVFRSCAARGHELPYGARCRRALDAL